MSVDKHVWSLFSHLFSWLLLNLKKTCQQDGGKLMTKNIDYAYNALKITNRSKSASKLMLNMSSVFIWKGKKLMFIIWLQFNESIPIVIYLNVECMKLMNVRISMSYEAIFTSLKYSIKYNSGSLLSNQTVMFFVESILLRASFNIIQ